MPFQVKSSFFSGTSHSADRFSALLPTEFQPDLATRCLILGVSLWGEAIP